MSGITLIELMVTLSIAAIMLTLAAPGFQTFIRTSHVRTITNDFSSLLNLARSESIKRGWPVSVCKSSNINDAAPACNNAASWQDGWLVFIDFDQDGTVDVTDQRLRVGKPDHTSTTISGGTNFSNFITYLPTGVSQGNGGLANGTIDICLQGIKRSIVISTTGRISIESGSCT